MPTDTRKEVTAKIVGKKVVFVDSKTRVIIDEDRHEVTVDGNHVNLAPKEFLVLVALKNSGKTMSRTDIMRAVWGAKSIADIDARTVDQHVARLRRKISNAGIMGSLVVKTQNSFGYMYKAL